jgi:hypothetical protein
MKIAVLLSGQLRQWEYAKENQKWFWETSGATQIDYFIHTWSYSGDRKGVSQEYEWKDIAKSEFKQIVDWYDCKGAIYDRKPQEYFYENDHWSGLFFSLAQSIMLKKDYEDKNNFQYDLVIKSRPDIVFNPNKYFTHSHLEDNVLYTTHGGNMEHEHDLWNFNDCCFYGNSMTMDLLVGTYFYRQKVINGNSGHDIDNGDLNFFTCGPGTLIAEYCREYGINFFSTQPMRGGWQETLLKLGCPQDLNLLDTREFQKVEKYFRDWYTK